MDKNEKDVQATDIYPNVGSETSPLVLLVDDEVDLINTLAERLMLRGVRAGTVYNGESALEVLPTAPPQLMVLDLNMPGMYGVEVLRRVKETHPEIKVIILTGHGSETDRQDCMALGAFDYLHKPVDFDTLNERLKAAHEEYLAEK